MDNKGKGIKIGKTVIKTKLIVIGLILILGIVGIVVLVQLIGFQFYLLEGTGTGGYQPSTEYNVGNPVLDEVSPEAIIEENIKLEWSLESPFTITGFIILGNYDSGEEWFVITILGNVYTYTTRASETINAEGLYGFKVMGVATIEGTEHNSQFSNERFVRVTSQVITIPTLKVIESPNTDGTVELDWDAVANPFGGVVSGYLIYRQIELGGWIEIGEVLSGITDYTDNVSVNGTYQYYIRTVTYVFNLELISDPSNTQTVEVLFSGNGNGNGGAPETPVLKTIDPATDIDGEIDLEWDSVDRADYYDIQRKKDSGSWMTIKDDYKYTTYTDSIPENGVYEYQINAGNVEGDSGYSNIESVTVEIPEEEEEEEEEEEVDDEEDDIEPIPEADEEDYTMIYVLVAVLGGAIGIVVFIQYRKKKSKSPKQTKKYERKVQKRIKKGKSIGYGY